MASLIDKEVEQGWVQEIHGGETAARARWPDAVAIGKLNLVQAKRIQSRGTKFLSKSPAPCFGILTSGVIRPSGLFPIG